MIYKSFTIFKGMKAQPGPSKDETLDTLFQGKLAIIQKRRGYRFSLDAILLADFVGTHGGERIIDVGSGNGVVALVLAFLHPSVQLFGLEIQEKMVERASRSVALNGLESRVEILHGDVCSIQRIFASESFDIAVCNPPYRRLTSGRINPDPERRVARHEIKGSLSDFVRAGSYLLRRKGRMALVYPATRLLDLLQLMRQERMEPKRLRLVHSFEKGAATLALVEGILGGRSELKVMPPLIVYARENQYGPEIRAILQD